MAMAGLQRSAVSFRRQGSSGFVWDDRFLSVSGELNSKDDDQQQQQQQQEDQHHNTATTLGLGSIERSRSNGGGGRAHRTGKVSPAIEPPSPKLSACGFCAAFGKTGNKAQRSKHRSR